MVVVGGRGRSNRWSCVRVSYENNKHRSCCWHGVFVVVVLGSELLHVDGLVVMSGKSNSTSRSSRSINSSTSRPHHHHHQPKQEAAAKRLPFSDWTARNAGERSCLAGLGPPFKHELEGSRFQSSAAKWSPSPF